MSVVILEHRLISESERVAIKTKVQTVGFALKDYDSDRNAEKT